MAGLPRDIIKWIQSLDLTWQITVPKWDLSNGYLVAEMFGWYYPNIMRLKYFINGSNYEIKILNWIRLKRFIRKKHFPISDELIEGTIHCWEGAAAMLVQQVYEILTHRQVRSKSNPERLVDFTDHDYQAKLPLHCRTTATRTIDNNTKITEILSDGWGRLKTTAKAKRLLDLHNEQRRLDRRNVPQRYGIKPSLGEMAVRREPVIPIRIQDTVPSAPPVSRPNLGGNERSSLTASVQFREINVKQADKHILPQLVQG